MIEIIKKLNIEVSKPNVFQAVVAKQYDMNTRFIKATFVDGGEKISIDPTSTVKVVINALRPDGESKGFDGVINEDGTVTVPLHSWMLELDGTVICDISVIDTATDDNKKLTTTSFTLIVEKAAYGGGDVTNDPQYDVLVSLLETCQEAGAVAQEALDKSNEANEKYTACVEATANANKAAEDASAVRAEVEAGGFIESLKEQNEGEKFSVWVGKQEEYDAITAKDSNCLYIVEDDVPFADGIVETGTKEVNYYSNESDDVLETIAVWGYELWSSGKAICYAHLKATAIPSTNYTTGVHPNVLKAKTPYPIKFVDPPVIMLTISNAASSDPELDRNVKSQVLKSVDGFQALVHDPSGGFTETDTADVDVYLIGRWK